MAEVLGQIERDQGRRPRWLRIVLEWLMIAALAATAAIAVKWWMSRDLLPADGERPPDIAYTDLLGGPHQLADLAGKPVLLHFWATWCGACKLQVDTLNELYDQYGHQIAFAAVALRSTPEQVQASVDALGIRYPVYVAGDDVGFQMKIQQFPTTYAIDAAGGIRARDTGWSPGFRLDWMVESALEASR